ncbi:MAG: hypothetical protein ACLQOO_23355 [Terriglobia bacterium]
MHHDTGQEYLLTGSAAFVEAWLEQYPHKLTRQQFVRVLRWVGDLDLIHTGSWPDDHGRLHVRATVQRWVEENGSAAKKASAPEVTAHPLRTWAGALYLLQCVIPDAQFLVTTEGVLDPWRGHSCSVCGSLPKLYIPPLHVWQLNPQNRTGAAGLADGVLIYLNRLMLEVLLHTLNKPPVPPKWLTEKFPDAFDRLLEMPMRETASVQEDVKCHLWFGVGARIPSPDREAGLKRQKLGGRDGQKDESGLVRRLKRSQKLYKTLQKAAPGVSGISHLMCKVAQYTKSFDKERIPG